jgi:hypothetical protein
VISEGELLINSGERRVRVRKPPLRTSPRRSMPDRTAPGTGPSIADGLAGSEIRLMDPGTGLDFGPVVEQYVSLAFCIPPNAELLDYWNRVEDRLFKLRNCMDITGARRRPPLFEPPIDPRMLVRLKAAGLTLDDVLDTTSTLPPYRFTFLLDRARSYATTVQAFGSALLAAIEKKDGLELERLRLTHQQNLATLATSSQRWEVRVAEESLEAVRRQRETIQHRHDHFANLLAGRKNLWEVMQGASVHGASVLRLLAAHLTGTAGALHLIPQVGAPTAMKYGGVELGNSTQAWAAMFRDSAGVLDLVASSTGLEATFARREEGWAHEVDAAELDLRALDKQILAAEFRVEIAKRALQTHEKSIEHTEEVFRLYQDRFTNLGLYSWQVTNLQRLYRGAWQSAWTFARYCEQAYRYERGADGPPLGTGHWDGARAGLLAGESLVLALQELERRFLESNHRGHDVEQRFSLLQLDPGKLLELRATGKCEISVPEFWFDLHYPGHYRRRIKGVRLSIPCVAGPYTNVGAVLTLLSSSVRETATAPALTPDPAGRTQSVATSGAVNDAGVFEFSFRDERYMPFEGAGAAGSSWRLQLPDAFRAFDYDTISDVVLSIAYTAEYDESLRARVEESTELTTARLVSMLETDGIQVLVSLRHSFSEAFTRLLRAPADTDCSFELTEREVPHFLRGRNLGGRNLVVEDAKVKLRLAADLTAEGFELTFDGGVHPLGWTTADDEPPTADVTLGHLHGTHFFTLGGTGSLGPGPGGARVDGSKLLDVLLELHLKLSPLPQPPP